MKGTVRPRPTRGGRWDRLAEAGHAHAHQPAVRGELHCGTRADRSFFPPAHNGRGVARSLADYAGHRVAYLREAVAARGDRPRAPRPGSMRALVPLARQAQRGRRDHPSPVLPGTPTLIVHTRDDHHVAVDFALAAKAPIPLERAILAHGGHQFTPTSPERTGSPRFRRGSTPREGIRKPSPAAHGPRPSNTRPWPLETHPDWCLPCGTQALPVLDRAPSRWTIGGQNPAETRRHLGQNPSALEPFVSPICRQKAGTPVPCRSACHAEALWFGPPTVTH
jgi:hypothetical protein